MTGSYWLCCRNRTIPGHMKQTMGPNVWGGDECKNSSSSSTTAHYWALTTFIFCLQESIYLAATWQFTTQSISSASTLTLPTIVSVAYPSLSMWLIGLSLPFWGQSHTISLLILKSEVYQIRFTYAIDIISDILIAYRYYKNVFMLNFGINHVYCFVRYFHY